MAIPVAIAALAMLFPAAQNWAEWNMANRKILNLRETMEGVRLEIENSPRDVQNAVREVLNRQTALLDHMRKEARNGFFPKRDLNWVSCRRNPQHRRTRYVSRASDCLRS